jgi:hypothetical protein
MFKKKTLFILGAGASADRAVGRRKSLIRTWFKICCKFENVNATFWRPEGGGCGSSYAS